MEFIVDSQRTEQVKIFGILKKTFAEGGTDRHFEKLKPVPHSCVPLEKWEESYINEWIFSDYLKMYYRKIDGILRYLAVASQTGRQYVVIIK